VNLQTKIKIAFIIPVILFSLVLIPLMSNYVLFISASGILSCVYMLVAVNRKIKHLSHQIHDNLKDLTKDADDANSDNLEEVVRFFSFYKDRRSGSNQDDENNKIQHLKAIEKQNKIQNYVDNFQQNFAKTIDKLIFVTSDLKASAEGMVSISNDLNNSSNSVTDTANIVQSNVQAAASAAGELSLAIEEINGQIYNSVNIINNAVEKSKAADATVLILQESTNKIGEIVLIISNIASQINLLALNATIESARAGEFGKGFAVVASEVKNLAIQTSRATDDVAKQISDVQDISKVVNNSIKEISTSVEGINKIESIIASAVEEQSASTKQISNNVMISARSVSEVSQTMISLSKTSAEVHQSTNKVFDAVLVISEQSEVIRKEIKDFLDNIKNA
jgi:methyl-accepting chemotaxis protein